MTLKCTIEIPKKSLDKLEVNKATGKLELDRRLNQPIPEAYGFVNDTLVDDGDALDVFVVSNDDLHSLDVVNVVPVFVVIAEDQGVRDDKVIASVDGRLDSHEPVAAIRQYLETYKAGFVVKEIVDASNYPIKVGR